MKTCEEEILIRHADNNDYSWLKEHDKHISENKIIKNDVRPYCTYKE